MSRLRHEKGVRAGAGSGVHRAQASKPLPFTADEERKCGGNVRRKSGGSVLPEKVDKGEGPNRLGRKRGGAISGPGTHGTDATPDRGMKFGTKLQGLRMDEPDKSEQRRPFKQGGEVKNWIKGAHIKKGALHRELHVPDGEKIPEKRLEKAEHSSDPTLRRRASLAKTLKGLHH